MIDMADMETEHLEMALEKLDQVVFDPFHFEQILSENSLQFLFYKIFQQHQLLKFSNTSLESLSSFAREIS